MTILGAGFLVGPKAHAAENLAIWSTTSPLANQSTEALADGRHTHAIRFAKGVLRTKTNAGDHLIARQNLCLAYLARGERDEAEPFCDAALTAEVEHRIVERDGRRITQASGDPATPTLAATVRANIAQAQGNALAQNR